jgi:hypothetical protein
MSLPINISTLKSNSDEFNKIIDEINSKLLQDSKLKKPKGHVKIWLTEPFYSKIISYYKEAGYIIYGNTFDDNLLSIFKKEGNKALYIVYEK